MATRFATLEGRANSAVFRTLANAEATAGSATFPVVFDHAYASGLGDQVETESPTVQVRDTDVSVAALTQGAQLSVSSRSYVITGVEPDGTGVTRLRLREVGP